MRKFLVILLCFSFIVTPVSSIQAQEKGAKGKPSAGAYMNQVLGIGTAVIGTSILLKCKLGAKTPSNLIFFSGALIYVASEIMGGKAQQAFLKANTEEIDQLVKSQKEGGGDAQKAIIETKLQEEEDKLAFVNKRKTWMMAITAVYYAATAAAIAEHYQVWNLVDVCEGGTTIVADTKMGAVIAGAYSFLSGYGSGSLITSLIAAITGVILVYHASFVPNMSVATTRAIAFGAAAVLATATTVMLSSEAKKIQENIAKLKELVAKFKSDTTTDGGLTEGAETAGAAAGVNGGVIPNGSGINTAANIKPVPAVIPASRSCWANTANGMVFSESACKNPLNVPRPSLNANLNLPTLKSVTESGADLAQAVSDGDTNRADVLAGQLAANASRMKDIKDKLLKQMNDKLKVKGKKPFDLDKEVNKRISQLEAGANKNLASKGFGSMASIGGASLEDIKKEVPTNPIGVRGRDTIAIQPSNTSSNDDENSLSEGVSEESVADEEASTLSESLDDFETNESDISTRPGDSIFDLISTRYLLNYHRFFKKKEVEEEVPAKEP